MYCKMPKLLDIYKHRSWAIVTFVNQRAAKQCADQAADGTASHSMWDAEPWSKIEGWDVAEWHGSKHLGENDGQNENLFMSNMVAEHNRNLHDTIDAAMDLKKKVDQARTGARSQLYQPLTTL